MNKLKIKLGDLLVTAKVITEEQLQSALEYQKKHGGKLGNILIELNFITELNLITVLSKQLNLPLISLNNTNIDLNVAHKIPEKICKKFKVIAIEYKDGNYIVGMVEPTDVLAYDEVVKILGNSIQIAIVKETELSNIADKIYRRTEDIASFAKELKDEIGKELTGFNISEEAVAGNEISPVAKLLDSIFEDAVQIGSSDIHIEPESNLVRIRQRVDGVLQESIIEGRQIADSLILRIKLLAKLNISEKRLPQDGRFVIKVKNKSLDVRAAIMPIRYGETAVLRLLDQSSGILSIQQLISQQDLLNRILFHINRPSGLILVTGPTGSGKTTTLYSILNELNVEEKKIISIEDPIEYSLARITQIQVNNMIGLTFGKVLRTVLRQDPEIIMIGEMRDEETAQIGLRAAMTGHLVLATLHTNDAISSAVRLIDMGIPPYLAAAALRAVIGQRLIRKICPNCRVQVTIGREELALLKSLINQEVDPNWKFQKGHGCTNCNNTGYKGRIAAIELFEMNFQLANALRTKDTEHFNEMALKQSGFKPLALNMLEMVLQGITSVEEVFKKAIEVADLGKDELAANV